MPARSAPDLSDSTNTLSPLTYYLLVVVSFTGLSTLLGLTESVDAREIGEKDQAAVIASGKEGDDAINLSPLLRSIRDPANIAVSIDALKYVAKRSDVDKLSDFRIVRRFEYDFRLIGINVIMIHMASPAQEGGTRPLHLIEVYQVRNPVLRSISRVILTCFQSVWPSIESFLSVAGLGNAASCRGRQKKGE